MVQNETCLLSQTQRAGRDAGLQLHGHFSELFFFLFQAEDGIRDGHVTGVQTCALPICGSGDRSRRTKGHGPAQDRRAGADRVSRHGSLSRRHLVGQACDLLPSALHRWKRDGAVHERRESLLTTPDGQLGRQTSDLRPRGDGEPHGAAAAPQQHLPRGLHGHSDGNAGRRGSARARRALHRLPVHGSVRIAYDVTPLSHPRTGVGNYILGALTGMLAAAAGGHELVAFGPVSIRGRRLLDETLAGLAVERRIVTVPFAHATRRAWGALGRPPAERFLGGFDVMHFSDWMVPPQRAGARATMIHDLGPLRYPERLHPRTVSMHMRTAREAARCDVVFTNAEFTANDVAERRGVPRARIRVAYPGVGAHYRS